MLPADNSQLSHIFGDRPGHLPDTPANRQRLVDVANDRDNYRGVDKYGNKWFVEEGSDGNQIWVTTRNGVIQNGGSNNPPLEWDENTGLNRNPFKKR